MEAAWLAIPGLVALGGSLGDTMCCMWWGDAGLPRGLFGNTREGPNAGVLLILGRKQVS